MTYSIFDAFDRPVKGGFPSEEAATEWLTAHPKFRVLDEDEELVDTLTTAFEADLVIGDKRWKKEPVPVEDYMILPTI
jgi:hypothetical protein